jgi:hypothetical protein
LAVWMAFWVQLFCIMAEASLSTWFFIPRQCTTSQPLKLSYSNVWFRVLFGWSSCAFNISQISLKQPTGAIKNRNNVTFCEERHSLLLSIISFALIKFFQKRKKASEWQDASPWWTGACSCPVFFLFHYWRRWLMIVFITHFNWSILIAERSIRLLYVRLLKTAFAAHPLEVSV